MQVLIEPVDPTIDELRAKLRAEYEAHKEESKQELARLIAQQKQALKARAAGTIFKFSSLVWFRNSHFDSL